MSDFGAPPPPMMGSGPPVPGPPGMGLDPTQLVTQDQTFVNREKPHPGRAPAQARQPLAGPGEARQAALAAAVSSGCARTWSSARAGSGRTWPRSRSATTATSRTFVSATFCSEPPNSTRTTRRCRPSPSPRLIATVWDGSEQQLLQAQQSMMMGAQTGMLDPNAMAILQDAAMVKQFEQTSPARSGVL